MYLIAYFKKNQSIFRFIGWYFFTNGLLFWLIGLRYLKSILLSGSIFKNSVIDYSNFIGKIFVLIFTFVNYLSFMQLLAFIPAIFLFLLAIFFPYKRFILFFSSICAGLSILWLLIDNHIFSLYKFHLNNTILFFLLNENSRTFFDFSQYEIYFGAIITSLIFLFELCLAIFIWKKIILPNRLRIGEQISSLFLGGLLFSYFTLMLSILNHNNLFSQQTPNLPLYSQLFSYVIPSKDAADILLEYSEHHFSQPFFTNENLNYPLQPMQCKLRNQPYNIILIMVDSLRFDSLKFMPNLNKFAEKGWLFLNHMSAGNATQPALFSIFYSLPSNYWTAALKQKKSPVLFNELLKNNYHLKAIWSGAINFPPFDKVIFRQFNDLEMARNEDMGDKDRNSTKKMIEFLKMPHRTPFFLNLFYNAPHAYCRNQSFPAIHQPAKAYCNHFEWSNDVDPLPYYNRYLNAVSFIDQEINQVFEAIENEGYLKNSIVIFTSDHGQEFNDNKLNYWDHASNFTSAQIQVPLIIYWPGEKPRTFNYLTTSYDLIPSLVERIFSCTNERSDYSIGQNLLTQKRRLPFVLTGSYVNTGIVEATRITTLETSGRIIITDLKATPLENEKPNLTAINEALHLMRKYFSETT